MSIDLSCKCGKKLRAKEEWSGTRVKCPACGNILTVPGKSRERVAVPSPPRSEKKPEKVAAREEEDFDDLDAPPVRKKKRKKSKRGFRLSVPEFDFLGIHMTLRKWVGLICFLAIVVPAIYYFWPRFHPKLVDARFVDAYAALEVADRNIAKEIAGDIVGLPGTTTIKGALRPGGNKFMVVRDTPEGESVLVHLSLPPKFLHNHANFDATGTLNLKEEDFLLQGDGQPVKSLLFDMERLFESPTEGVVIDFSRSPVPDPVIPRERPPWFPQGEIVKEFKATIQGGGDLVEKKGMQSSRDLYAQQDQQAFVEGFGAFHSARGMVVNYNFSGSAANVTWDTQSKAYVGSIYQGLGSSQYMLASLEIIVVFPRPPGKELTLTVMGERMGKIKPH